MKKLRLKEINYLLKIILSTSVLKFVFIIICNELIHNVENSSSSSSFTVNNAVLNMEGVQIALQYYIVKIIIF